jgi:hypothetical protein
MALTTHVRKLPPPLQNDNNILKAEKYTTDMYFNPQKDINGVWFISEEEYTQMDQTIIDKYPILQNLDLIPYEPVPPIDPHGIPIGPPATE